MEQEEHFEVVVVGAGMAALVAAKGYLECAPQTDLVIFDDKKTVGGVWSKENIYPGLQTNNYRGTLEYPDYPFGDDRGVPHLHSLPGEAMHQYFYDFAAEFDLLRRVRHEIRVLEAEKIDEKLNSGWKLLLKTPEGRSSITTDKLIIGTGLHNTPLPVQVQGKNSFNAPVLHSGQLGREGVAVATNEKVRRVTVYGGSKYAFDSVYKFAAAGKEIDWVISRSGYGPTFMANNLCALPLLGKIWVELLVTTRFISWFSPCSFGGLDGSGWWRWLLHSTRLGRKLVAAFWAQVGHDTLEQAGYFNDPKLEPLLPDSGWFDIATSLGTLNYPTNLLDFVRSGQVTVHRKDISHLSDHTVNLQDGTALPSDAFISSTGWQWRPTVTFKPASLDASLGVASDNYTAAQEIFWSTFDAQADQELFSRFPILQTRPYPPSHSSPSTTQPQRLHRLITPPLLSATGDRTLAFAGAGANISHILKATITSIWIYAYFTDKLSIDPCHHLGETQVCYEAALTQRWSLRRYTYGFGKRFVDFVWDAVPWNDVLLKDLGLEWKRKKGAWFGVRWWREMFEPYTVADYRWLGQEWLEKQRGKVA
ncbi:Dimethylaniline monooxygenase [N-oxide-forming] 2 [Cercospora zeina]